MKQLQFLVILLALAGSAICQTKHALTFDDMIGWGRVADPQISPDGQWVAYTVTKVDKNTNKGNADIWLVPFRGGEARQLTTHSKSDNSPRWLPDSKTLLFVSTREGASEIYALSIAGGESRKVTTISTGASGLVVSPNGRSIAFASDVYPDCPNDDCNKQRSTAAEDSKVKAKIFTHLPYRVWDHYRDGTRSHIFVLPLDVPNATPIDVTPGDYDTPPIDIGGSTDYTFSQDGSELAFVRNTDPIVAVSTNNDIFIVPLKNGKPAGETKRITANKATDNQPMYSPDGKHIAYRAMKRPGFEADKYVLTLFERGSGKLIPLTESIDRSVGDVAWARDGKSLYFATDNEGYRELYSVSIPEGKGTPAIKQITQKLYITEFGLAPSGNQLVLCKTSIRQPAELWRIDGDGKNLVQLTHTNDASLAQLEMNALEEFQFKGAGGTSVHGFLLKPPFFDASKKYPMIYLVHGGPQGEWGDMNHYRWNVQMFASRGYVVVMVNPRGSTGFGQKFTDEISQDWGGKVYNDLMNGVEYVTKTYPFIDKNRIGAAGASYGGYMINWIEGHNDKGIFKALVSHDGMFNPVSAYGATEELWFNEWEFGGTPWKNPALYEKYAPCKFVKNFKTPMLVVHGQLDYRLDVSEGFQLFTALQKMNVPSKFLYFPDEGHWVMKPQNSELWYKTVLDWMDEYLKK